MNTNNAEPKSEKDEFCKCGRFIVEISKQGLCNGCGEIPARCGCVVPPGYEARDYAEKKYQQGREEMKKEIIKALENMNERNIKLKIIKFLTSLKTEDTKK